MMLGEGKAIAATDADIARLADSLKVHPADLEAIAQVESAGFGWFPDGRIKILFEKHWFWKLLPDEKRTNAAKNGLARKNWIAPAKGGYSDQKSPDDRYRLLERAIKVDREAAFKSVSIGTFQIMGFNHAACGHQSAEQMFTAFCESEVYQLSALAGFLRTKKLIGAIQSRDFDAVEKGYNGGGLNGAYAKKMREASDKLRAGKWKGYIVGSSDKVVVDDPGVKPAPIPTPKPTMPEAPAKLDRQPDADGNWLAKLIDALLKIFTRKV